MKTRGLSRYAPIAALTALLPLSAVTSHAASAPSSLDASVPALQQEPERVEWWNDEKRHKLRRAYWLLEQADREYGGHKAKAMEEIKKAGEMMHMDLHGEGYGGEHIHWSDERLREARGLLKDVVEESGGREHEHIRMAIKEIDHALEVH